MKARWLKTVLLTLVLFSCAYVWYFHYEVAVSVDFNSLIHSPYMKRIRNSLYENDSRQKIGVNISAIEQLVQVEKKQISDEILGSYNLSTSTRILCWVMTNPKNHQTKAQKVKQTWGKRCNILLFMSSTVDPELPSVKLDLDHDGRDRLWAKTKQAFKYTYDHYSDKADWFLKADDDTYVVVENLRHMLKEYNASDLTYFGLRFTHHEYTNHKEGYMSGGAGYVLSKEAVNRFVNFALKGNVTKGTCNHKQDSGNEDVEIGLCLNSVGVHSVDTRDKLGKHRFLGDTPQNWLDSENWSAGAKSYPFYPVKKGMSCCSDRVITFHYVSPQMMLALEYLIYHVKPYGEDSNLWTTRKPDNSSVRTHLDSSKSANIKTIQGSYFLSPFGGLCSDINSETIETLKECRSVVVGGANFTNETHNSAWPKGCYVRGTPPKIWWNNHPTGIPHDNARQICIQLELQNLVMDCWYHCNSQQGPCSWCGSRGMCCTRKPGYTDKSNGCDGTIGGLTRHECSLIEKSHPVSTK